MKLRLVQDSYTKQYTIEYWYDPIARPTGLPALPPYTSGYWMPYKDPTCRLPNDPDYIATYYKESEREKAERDFLHLVNTYNSKKIVLKTFDSERTDFWKKRVSIPNVGECDVKDVTVGGLVVELYQNGSFVNTCSRSYAEAHIVQ